MGYVFKQRINRALQARLAAWEVEVRTAISDQLTGRLEAIAEERDTQLHPHSVHPRTAPWSWLMGGDSATKPAGQCPPRAHASDWSGRLTKAAEERALQWASLGVTHMSNLFIRTERGGPWRLMTPEEAEDCHEVPREE